MTVNSVSEQPRNGEWSETDEIDVGRYLGILRRRWLQILLVTLAVIVLTGLAVYLYQRTTPPVYKASATAALVRTMTDVRFDDRFTTSSDQPNDVGSRRAGLVAMVKSGAIAQNVIDTLGDQLPSDLRNPSQLLHMVTANMATAAGRAGQSDLIEISVNAPSPQLAAEIANAWAQAYVQQVNSVYGQVPDDMLGSVDAQLVQAQDTYATAQTNLEGYLATSQLDALVRQAAVISQTVETLQASRVQALSEYMNGLVKSHDTIVQAYLNAQTENQVLAFNKEQEGERAQVAAYLDAYNAAQVDTFTAQSDRNRTQLQALYDQWLRTNGLLIAAQTLQDQAATGDDSTAASTALALQVLNLQIVNNAATVAPGPSKDYLAPGSQTVTQLPNETTLGPESVNGKQAVPQEAPALQVQLVAPAVGAISASDLQKQMNATVTSLERQLETIEQNIAQLHESLLSGSNFEDLNAAIPPDSALVQAIANAYPALFNIGAFSGTAWQANNNALFVAGQAQAAKFFDLADAGALPTVNSPDSPLTNTIAQLEEQLRDLRRQIEIENARRLQFAQQRDLAWESVQALSNKQAELRLARAAANSEVRLSGVAVPLDEPVPQLSFTNSLILAVFAGLLLGVFVAFVRELNAQSSASV